VFNQWRCTIPVFNDAYQFIAADEYGLVLVSFDTGFDRIPLQRRTPQQVLNTMREHPGGN
jgi:hypothetical protein